MNILQALREQGIEPQSLAELLSLLGLQQVFARCIVSAYQMGCADGYRGRA